MRIALPGFIVVVATALGGCASTPDVTATYYLPSAMLEVSVIRTVGCDALDNPSVATSVLSKVVYSRDEGQSRQISLKELDGAWTNTEMTVNFYEDGRLSGINTAQTGQGTEIVKSAAVLAAAVMAAAGTPQAIKDACTLVRKVAKDKGVTLTFTTTEAFDSGSTFSKVIEPAADSAAYYKTLKPVMGDVCLKGVQRDPKPRRAAFRGDAKGHIMVGLVEPAIFDIHVLQAGNEPCTSRVWTAPVAVPQRGERYDLVIPKARAFGKQTFAVSVAESGAVTMLKYGKDSGAAGVMTAGSELAGAFTTTAAEAAARMDAEADIIAQQQRLIRCRTDPTTCAP